MAAFAAMQQSNAHKTGCRMFFMHNDRKPLEDSKGSYRVLSLLRCDACFTGERVCLGDHLVGVRFGLFQVAQVDSVLAHQHVI